MSKAQSFISQWSSSCHRIVHKKVNLLLINMFIMSFIIIDLMELLHHRTSYAVVTIMSDIFHHTYILHHASSNRCLTADITLSEVICNIDWCASSYNRGGQVPAHDNYSQQRHTIIQGVQTADNSRRYP